jgi:ubiquinone/menaquinone biosynthesis C-methylase UbiE
MNHSDHVRLLHGGVPEAGGMWADLGAGAGAFTLALADLLGPAGTIYAVDRDRGALAQGERAMRSRFPETTLHVLQADFTQPLDLPPLDGVVMANSLHFHRAKEPILEGVRGMLKHGGRLIVVEYNAERGNQWVPYPISYPGWEALARRAGFTQTHLLGRQPSRFLREIYSAVSDNE